MDSEIKDALRRRAVGYVVEELTEEFVYTSDEGRKKIKEKIHKKEVPSDLTAIKMWHEFFEEKKIELSDEELEKELQRLLGELKG